MNTEHAAVTKRKLQHSNILKALLYFHNLAALTIYFFVRLLFHDYPIPFTEDVLNLLKTLLIANALATGIYLLYLAITAAMQAWKQRSIPAFDFSISQTALLVLLFSITVLGCSVQFH